MTGDFTRFTFDRRKHYSSVRMQQGRVQLDADWNEYADIISDRIRTETRDFIGANGAPKNAAGFEIKKGGSTLEDLRISPGRLYVDGILCENEAEIGIGEQPDLPDYAADLPGEAGLYLVYLDVWSRHITALDDPGIREVSLDGADTSTRVKTTWQVRLLRIAANGTDPASALPSPKWDETTEPSTGKLKAQVSNSGAQLRNQLYRIQIHRVELATADSPAKVCFKWSRDNASVVADCVQLSERELRIDRLAGPTSLAFAPGDWVELTDSASELRHKPGTLVQVERAGRSSLTIDPDTAPGTLEFADPPAKRRARSWSAGEILAATGSWIPIEDGLEVQFDSGTFVPGDYWLIPARSFTRNIEWPRDGGTPIAQLPHGVAHHYCRLALVDFDPGSDLLEVREDSRFVFLPMIDLKGFMVLRAADNAPTGAVYVDSQGQVGLGTTEPLAQLHVARDFRVEKGVSIDDISANPKLGNSDSAVPTQKAVKDYVEAVKDYVDELLVGSVTAFAMKTPPTGWLECNGQAISRTDYKRLFEKIGTAYGSGNDEKTFNVPDLRGEFIRGWDNGVGGIDPGRTLGSGQVDQFQVHKHSDAGHLHYISGAPDLYPFYPFNPQYNYNSQYYNNYHYYYDHHYYNRGEFISAETHLFVAPCFAFTPPYFLGGYMFGPSSPAEIRLLSSTEYVNIGEPTTSGGRAPSVGSETRPRNVALLYCIKY